MRLTISPFFSVLTTIIFTGAAINALADGGLRTLALTGQPGLTPLDGVTFDRFGTPKLTSSGDAIFVAGISGPGVSSGNDIGVWRYSSGEFSLLVREGATAPGAAGEAVFSRFHELGVNHRGDIALRASLAGFEVTSANNGSVWGTAADGSLTLLAREGESAAGVAEGVVHEQLFGEVRLNASGQVAYQGALGGTGVDSDNRFAVWLGGPTGDSDLVAREGESAPGAPEGARFASFSRPVVSDSGHFAFRGFLAGGGGSSNNKAGIWRRSPDGGLQLLALEEEQAAGFDEGFLYGDLLEPTLNASGEVALAGTVARNGAAPFDALWVETVDAGLSLFAHEGMAAPHLDIGAYRSFSAPDFNAAGQTTYLGGVSGPGVTSENDEAIWRTEAGGSIQLVAREGDPITVLPNERRQGAFFPEPTINEAGQVAFWGRSNQFSVDEDGDAVLWAQDRRGTPRLIVAEGELIDVNDDPHVEDLRRIRRLLFDDNRHSHANGFNDLGQLAFYAEFTDGSRGLFVSDLTAAPSVTGDFDFSGVVNAADYAVLRDLGSDVLPNHATFAASYGAGQRGLSTSVAVPEPMGATLLLAGAGALFAARRSVAA